MYIRLRISYIGVRAVEFPVHKTIPRGYGFPFSGYHVEMAAYDALVVGAGIIGCSIAWRLAQRKLHVCLLDAGRLGGETSWAGAGMLIPGGEFEQPGPMLDFALESLALYPSYVEELKQESGAEIDFRKPGLLQLAFTAAEWEALAARARAQASLGIPVRHVSAGDIAEYAPVSSRAVGALFYSDDCVVDPRDTLRALHVACQRAGVDVREGIRARTVSVSGGAIEIEAAEERFPAGACVIAAGAWSGSIRASVHGNAIVLPECFPVKGHLIGYNLQPGTLGPLIRYAHSYVLQRGSGFTVAGTTEETAGFDRRIDPDAVAMIAEDARRLLPGFLPAEPSEAWVGFRPATPGHEPYIRRWPDTNLWLAYGHFRNGILLAPATARKVASELACG